MSLDMSECETCKLIYLCSQCKGRKFVPVNKICKKQLGRWDGLSLVARGHSRSVTKGHSVHINLRV